MKVGDEVVKAPCLRRTLPHVSLTLYYGRCLAHDGLVVEEKHDSEDLTAAFCVDWRYAKDGNEARPEASQIISYCKRLPVTLIKDEGQPFFDVYPCSINKGRALEELKQRLQLNSGIMYLGGSSVDNTAFRIAEVVIGVLHGETQEELACDYFTIRFEDITAFLRTLLQNRLLFNPELLSVLTRTQR